MAIKVGQAVKLSTSSVSTAGGAAVSMDEGLVGRVCRITPAGFCNVEFAQIGCRRVHQDRLVPTSAAAPACSGACSAS